MINATYVNKNKHSLTYLYLAHMHKPSGQNLHIGGIQKMTTLLNSMKKILSMALPTIPLFNVV